MKNSIVISGYPKSGNTWLTRLVGELINAPVEGFWNEPHNPEIAMEGEQRNSCFRVFKSHHQLTELDEIERSPDFIIYIVRDPRDVFLSAITYFKHSHTLFSNNRNNVIIKICNRIYSKTSISQSRFRPNLLNAILEGDSSIHEWMKVSWINHVEPYWNSKFLFIQYEDMLKNPYQNAIRILEYIGVEKSKNEIDESIKLQSFKYRKSKFISNKNTSQARFLNTGKSGSWKNLLTENEKSLFLNFLKKELEFFDYELH